MKKLFLLPTVLLAVLFSSPLLSQSRPTIAVLTLEAKNVGQETADAVADILSTELFNSQRFKVIERQAILRILEEQKLQMTGVTDMGKAVEIGKILNVEKILIGSVSRLGESYIINTRLVDVKTAALEVAQNVTSKRGEEGLTGAITDLVEKLSEKVQVEGSIIRIKGEVILVDLGVNHGMSENQEVRVVRLGDVVTDLGGTVIGQAEDLIGSLVLTAVKGDYSEARIGVAKTPFRVGDKVRIASGRIEIEPVKPPEEKPVTKKSDKPKKNADPGQAVSTPPVF
ncbi:MAG TPA: CsgG/HfaB family protein [bacterium]|nr:CsgG/HfaB family protein [bacterium]HOC24613.1 CsgG/HfaB family protein [bacterium]HOY44365.1 CsgG/HfaB family protein [bacterium]HPG84258.1 CsgG/HfaB family protein [bacterium]HPM58458.1 CsgG/HfaB family protein [bacterium]